MFSWIGSVWSISGNVIQRVISAKRSLNESTPPRTAHGDEQCAAPPAWWPCRVGERRYSVHVDGQTWKLEHWMVTVQTTGSHSQVRTHTHTHIVRCYEYELSVLHYTRRYFNNDDDNKSEECVVVEAMVATQTDLSAFRVCQTRSERIALISCTYEIGDFLIWAVILHVVFT